MPRSKKWEKVLREIDTRPGQTAGQLAQRFQCSERTIHRYLRDIEEEGFSLYNDQGYRLHGRPHIRPLLLSPPELAAVILAEQIAHSHLDQDTVQSLRSALNKLRYDVRGDARQTAETVEAHTVVLPNSTTEADRADPLHASIYRAIALGVCMRFDYLARYQMEPEERYVEPIGVFHQESRWYLQAYDLNREGSRNFRLARIQNLVLTEEKFVPRLPFSAAEAAFHKWDIPESEPVQLAFRASETLARWMTENRPHPSMTVEETRVTLSVTDPDAFLRWFTSLDDAELLEPEWARQRLLERLQRLSAQYPSQAQATSTQSTPAQSLS